MADPHPYRVALESRDAAALAAALHPDVIFDTPAFEEPIRGRKNVLAITFRLSVEGHAIEGFDHLRLDEDGLVRRITVSMRPLASLQVLAERMAEPVAILAAGQKEAGA